MNGLLADVFIVQPLCPNPTHIKVSFSATLSFDTVYTTGWREMEEKVEQCDDLLFL